MIRRFVFALVATLVSLSGCSELPSEPSAPRSGPAAVLSSSIDLTGVLEFVELPDLTATRHAEKYIRAAEGGVVEINGFRVEIPAGALPADTLVTIDLPSDELLAKHVIAEFGPHGIQFNEPVTITVPLEGVIVPSGGVEVARWENEGWTSLGGAVSADGKFLSSQTPHFSTYSGHVLAGG